MDAVMYFYDDSKELSFELTDKVDISIEDGKICYEIETSEGYEFIYADIYELESLIELWREAYCEDTHQPPQD